MEAIQELIFSPYFSKEAANNIPNYNYQGKDYSKLVKYLQPFWNKLSTFIPHFVSPNVITIIGGLIALAGYVLTFAFGETYSPILCVFACLLFVYQTMDALDGLQGKKVGMYTNATTEIFDHGVDACVLIMTSLACVVAIGVVGSKLSAILSICMLSTFYVITWENTSTKIMIFRGGFLNPTESLVITELMFFISGLFPSLWTTPLRDFLSVAPGWFLLDLKLNEILVYSSIFSALSATYISMSAVLEDCYNKPSTRSAPIQAFVNKLTVLLPLVIGITLSTLWLIFGNGSALQNHPFLTLFMISVPWNTSILRLIGAEIADIPVDVSPLILEKIPLALPLLAAWVPFLHPLESGMMYISLALSSVLYCITLYKILGETCTAYGMDHFWSIPPNSKKEGTSKK